MYIGAFQQGDDIVIIERIDGERFIRTEPVDWSFYVKDKYGDYETIFGETLKKIEPENRQQFHYFKKKFEPKDIFESDVNRVHKYLSENYGEDDVPDLKVAFFDIEVGYRQETKYSNPDDAENDIISVAITDRDTRVTTFLTLPPCTMTYDEAVDIVDSITDHGEVFATEPELIDRMLTLLEPYDVISGWNSEAYDVKYIINRIQNIMDVRNVNRLCLCGQEPKMRTVENKKFKKMETLYDLVGRVHLDYMNLYKKYTYNELSSYSLDNVSYVELDSKKVEYSGTLDQLYKDDFEKFVRYNIQDTELVLRLDEKLKFIDTTNIRAHQNGVLIPSALGTVGIVEQAIINEGHRYYNKHFPDKVPLENDETGAAGAFVVDPKVGIKKFVSGNDINSLYPSAIRSLNMSPETIIGQVLTERTDAFILEEIRSGRADNPTEAWRGLFNTLEFDDVINRTDTIVNFEVNSTKEVIKTEAKNIYDMVFETDKYAISANGTVFSRTSKGIIPHLLERWYSDRKTMQAKAEEWESKLYVGSEEERKEAKYWYGYWDQRQLAKKIDLNSLYGALLNKHCRFYDKRLGQSTTLTGRSITRHMAAKINEIITGTYDYLGDSIIYGDTDSLIYSDIAISNNEKVSLEKLYITHAKDPGNVFWIDNTEYVFPKNVPVKSYDDKNQVFKEMNIEYIYRHKVKKDMYEIEDEYGNVVTVTGDHSIMVMRDGELVAVKPTEIQDNDLLVGDHYA